MVPRKRHRKEIKDPRSSKNNRRLIRRPFRTKAVYPIIKYRWKMRVYMSTRSCARAHAPPSNLASMRWPPGQGSEAPEPGRTRSVDQRGPLVSLGRPEDKASVVRALSRRATLSLGLWLGDSGGVQGSHWLTRFVGSGRARCSFHRALWGLLPP